MSEDSAPLEFEEFKPYEDMKTQEKGQQANPIKELEPHQIQPPKKKKIHKKHSQKRNLPYELIVTIKQMMNHTVMNLSPTPSNNIIKQVWQKFMGNTHYSKKVLAVMFNDHMNQSLLDQYGFGQIVKSYSQFKAAMMSLKAEMLRVMSDERIRLHIFSERHKVNRKVRLLVYVRHFVRWELAAGVIKGRPKKDDNKRIQRMFKQASEEQGMLNEMTKGKWFTSATT